MEQLEAQLVMVKQAPMERALSREGIKACNYGLLIDEEADEALECNAAEEQSTGGCPHEQRRWRGRRGRRGGRATRKGDEGGLEVNGAEIQTWEMG